MKAIILAAGRGSRLNPMTEGCPKCLTVLGDMTLIERQLSVLRGVGIDDIVIATGYRGDMLALEGTRSVHNPDWPTTNMVETLFRAADQFGDDLVVAYADIVYEPRVLAALLASPHDVSVAVDRDWRAYWEHRFDDPLSDAESLKVDARGRITDIGATVSRLDEIEAQYMGLMRFRGAGVAALEAARASLDVVTRPWMSVRPVRQAYMTDLLMEMILIGVDVHAVAVAGGWLEIDTVRDFETASAMIADGSIIDGSIARFFDPTTTPRRT